MATPTLRLSFPSISLVVKKLTSLSKVSSSLEKDARASSSGRVVGSNFLWEGDAVAGVGPITVDPSVQNRAVGRQLMEAVLERARQQGINAVRLVQAAYHSRSLSLYTKLGFVVREPLAVLQGQPPESCAMVSPERG